MIIIIQLYSSYHGKRRTSKLPLCFRLLRTWGRAHTRASLAVSVSLLAMTAMLGMLALISTSSPSAAPASLPEKTQPSVALLNMEVPQPVLIDELDSVLLHGRDLQSGPQASPSPGLDCRTTNDPERCGTLLPCDNSCEQARPGSTQVSCCVQLC